MNVIDLKQVVGECTGCTISGRRYESMCNVPRFFDRMEIVNIDVADTDHLIIMLEGEEDEDE